MKIIKKKNNSQLKITLEGRLDTNTSPSLEKELNITSEINEVVFDLEKLDYISSSGLRILLSVQKKLKSGKVVIKGANDYVKEVLDMTGFSDLFTLE